MNIAVRQHVTASATRLCRAEGFTRVRLWVPRTLSADQYDYDASVVFFSFSESECSIEDGCPMLFDTAIELDLAAGEEIWLVTSNEAYCGAVLTDREGLEE